MKDHGERIAVLETDNKHHKDTLTDVVEQLRELNDQVSEIKQSFTLGKGFLAGVAFVFSLMGAAFGLVASAILKKLGLQ